jgi:putative endonuclease
MMYVYILASGYRKALYTGVTNDLIRRVYEHKSKTIKGFTSRYGIDKLVYYEPHDSPEHAIRREKLLKDWDRPWKIRLIEESNHTWQDLYETLTL